MAAVCPRLSVCQCLGAACGAWDLHLCIPGGRGGQPLLAGTGLTWSRAGGKMRLQHRGRAGEPVAVLLAAPAGRGLGERRGWGRVPPCPGGILLLCGDEVTSVPADTARGRVWERGRLGECSGMPPLHTPG